MSSDKISISANLALKRAKKAQRRKMQVSEKRKAAALEASLAVRVIRASRAPIQHCLVTESLFDNGMGTVVLARGATLNDVTFGSFLVDVFCLGIKNVMFASLDGEVFGRLIDAIDASSPMIPVEPSYARKLLRDLAAWSQSIGFAPHQEFVAVEALFGDVCADASEAVFRFGRDGKPFYIPGPGESPPLVQRRIEHLQKMLGGNGSDLDTAA
jgi:hypothetical protein